MIQFEIRLAQNGDVSIAALRPSGEEITSFSIEGAKLLHGQLDNVIHRAEELAAA